MTHCQRYFSGLEINVKTNTKFLKLNKFVDIIVEKYLIFDQYYKEIRPSEVPNDQHAVAWSGTFRNLQPLSRNYNHIPIFSSINLPPFYRA